jgi:hypothetical protein
MDQARIMLDDYLSRRSLDQAMLFGVQKAVMVDAPHVLELFPAVSVSSKRVMVGPSRVLATASVLLCDVIGAVYDGLGFDIVGDDVFKDLVIAQIVEPTSLLDADRVLLDLGRRIASFSTRKRTLRRCGKRGYRDLLADACFDHAATSGDVSLILYDVTTLRTQAEREDDFRKVGFSKDRSIDPQIVVGLLMDRQGYPLQIVSFEGNKAEKHTIVPVINAFRQRHPIDDVIIAADAGMLSAANLKALDDDGYRFIVGSRATKAPIDLESHFVWHGDFVDDGQIVDTITPKIGRNIDNDTNMLGEPVWDPGVHVASWRAVWSYSTKRYVHDNKTLDLQQTKAEAVIDGDRPARVPRFVKTTSTGLTLDQASLARARRVAGLKGYVTNIPVTVMPAPEIIDRYHDLWHVENSFRITKTDLAARPFFARRRDAIDAHLTIVFAALAVSRAIQARAGMTIRRTLRTLRPLRSAIIHINGITTTLPPAITPDQQALIDAITATDQLRH